MHGAGRVKLKTSFRTTHVKSTPIVFFFSFNIADFSG